MAGLPGSLCEDRPCRREPALVRRDGDRFSLADPPPHQVRSHTGRALSTLPGGVGRRLLPVSLCPPKPAPPGHMSPVAAALWPGAQIAGRAGQAAPAPPTPWEARGRLPTAQASAPQSLRW